MPQKILEMTIGNRVWLIDADKIAQHYANYHGDIDGYQTVEEAYESVINEEDTLIDWLEHQMDFSDDLVIESYEDYIINDPFEFWSMCDHAELEYALTER